MTRRVIWKFLASAIALIAIAMPSFTAFADDKDPASSNIYWPPAKYTPAQLKSHIEKMQRVAPAARQAGYGEAMAAASDKILDSTPTESLRTFAAISLLDGLHQWADTEKNAEADKRLAEMAKKYAEDSDKKVAVAAEFYVVEQRVLKPTEIAPDDIPKVLDDVKAALVGKSLNAKYLRIANGTQTLINYLSTDEEAEKRFKEFGRIFAGSVDPAMIRLGNQMKTAKRDPKVVQSADKSNDKPADATVAGPTQPNATAAAAPSNETADQWLTRVESQLASLTGSAHDAEYQTEKDAFLKKYPHDPLRWRWNFMDARRAMADVTNREQGTKTAKAALAEVLAAKDAPQEFREQASVMNFKLDVFNRVPIADLTKTVSDHIKAFPKSPTNDSLTQSLLILVTKGQIDEQAIARLQELKSTTDGVIAAAAATRITELENLLVLKTNPLELKFTDVEGHPFNLESYRGKVVLVDFWATWCGPCMAGMPEVIEQYRKYHDQGLEIVGISFDQDKQQLQDITKERQMTWVQFFDGKAWENTYGKKYGIHAIPAMWLVGRDGKVVDFNARQNLPEKISQLMQKDGAEKQSTATDVKPPDKS